MNKETELVKKYRAIAESILRNKISPNLVYHTIDHTRAVVEAFKEIGYASNLSEKELELGTVAAWFHDTGYSKMTTFHEQESISIFSEKLDDGDFSSEDISTIHELIKGTRMPQQPTSMLGKVICDADLHHLGTESFYERSELLKKEMENGCDFYHDDRTELACDRKQPDKK